MRDYLEAAAGLSGLGAGLSLWFENKQVFASGFSRLSRDVSEYPEPVVDYLAAALDYLEPTLDHLSLR